MGQRGKGNRSTHSFRRLSLKIKHCLISRCWSSSPTFSPQSSNTAVLILMRWLDFRDKKSNSNEKHSKPYQFVVDPGKNQRRTQTLRSSEPTGQEKYRYNADTPMQQATQRKRKRKQREECDMGPTMCARTGSANLELPGPFSQPIWRRPAETRGPLLDGQTRQCPARAISAALIWEDSCRPRTVKTDRLCHKNDVHYRSMRIPGILAR